MQNCRQESWLSNAKYFIDDVPLLLKSEDLKTVPQVLSLLFQNLLANAGDFITWIAEVRRREEDGSNLSEGEKGRLALKVLICSNPTFSYSLIFFFPKVHIRSLFFRKGYCKKFGRPNFLSL